jgi:hypothetical protein
VRLENTVDDPLSLVFAQCEAKARGGEASEAEIGEVEVRVPVTEEEIVVEKWPYP